MHLQRPHAVAHLQPQEDFTRAHRPPGRKHPCLGDASHQHHSHSYSPGEQHYPISLGARPPTHNLTLLAIRVPYPAVGCKSGPLPGQEERRTFPRAGAKMGIVLLLMDFLIIREEFLKRGMELCPGQDKLLKLGLTPSVTLALCSQIFEVSIYTRYYNRPLSICAKVPRRLCLANVNMPLAKQKTQPILIINLIPPSLHANQRLKEWRNILIPPAICLKWQRGHCFWHIHRFSQMHQDCFSWTQGIPGMKAKGTCQGPHKFS